MMVFHRVSVAVLLYALFTLCSLHWGSALGVGVSQNASLIIDASGNSSRSIPDTLFGIFFEEINHAGAGGLWSELVSNRGFEAGGPNTPSNIDPWSIIGNESSIIVSTDRSSCFIRNEIALRMEALCDAEESNICPAGGVGIYNPGYWGMNIEQGKIYKVVLHVRTLESLNLSVSLRSSDGLQDLATANVIGDASDFSNWTKVELMLEAKGTDHKSRLQLTTMRKGVIWFDQVSAMPTDTYNGHGFRKELVSMLADLKPRFIRFPGGCFVEGEWLRNAFRWRETIGPWEERPGHFGDVWKYWTDDGLGYFEFLQLAEDLGALPIWVINNGVSHNDQVHPSTVLPFVQDILDSIEFARGGADTKWGSVRAEMGHPEPFQLTHIAIGNEDCGKKHYLGNYLKFYYAIKDAYPDIKIISNCDGSSRQLDHPADLYDFHIYTSANNMFSMAHQFDSTKRSNSGPKAFVSEYAVTGRDAGRGSFLAALAEAGFLVGLERNSDVVEMASYAPLFANDNDHRWDPDAIVFNSWQQYGTPSYWVQQFFKESSGATLLPATVHADSSISVVVSAITWQSSDSDNYYLRTKVPTIGCIYLHQSGCVNFLLYLSFGSPESWGLTQRSFLTTKSIIIVNFGSNIVNLTISITGLDSNYIKSVGSIKTVLTSSNLMDGNSFKEPNKVVPVQSMFENAGTDMVVELSPRSFMALDILLDPTILPVYKSYI